MDPALQGRVVLVAGAAGGLGSAAALACARAGATTILLGRKVAPLNRVYDAAKAAGPEPVLYPLDLEGASPDDYDQLAQAIEAEFGRAIHVDLTARWWLTQACLPLLAKSDAGAAVFVLDDPARSSAAFWGGYGLAQSAQETLVPMLQAELGEHGPRISGLRPGPMRTALRGKAYQLNTDTQARPADEYAAACVELLSPAGAAWRGKVREAAAR